MLAGACLALTVALAALPGTVRARAAAAALDIRIEAVNAHLAEAEPGYILLAGDSHAELNGATRICGRPVVNAGVSGSRAAEYAAIVARLRRPLAPAATVLTIGTNDLRRSLDPLAPRALSGFEAAASDLLASLGGGGRGGLLIVTAVPPLDPAVTKLDPAAVEAYSARLRALCAGAWCSVVDPFATLRGPGGSATAGALRDGVHLASYRGATARLEQEVCGRLPPR